MSDSIPSWEDLPTEAPPQPSGESPESPELPSWEDLPTAEEQHGGSFGESLMAAEQGLERGLTGGLSDIIAAKYRNQAEGMTNDEAQRIGEDHPVASTLGNIAGTVGLLGLTGGLGTEALAAKAGLEGIPALVAANTAQGAALSASQAAANDIAYGDPSLTASKIAADAGISALWGGATAGVGSAILGKIGNIFSGKNGTVLSDLTNRLQVRAQYPEPVDALTKELTPYLKMNEDGFNVFGSEGLKMQAIEKLMPEQLSDQMVGQAQGLLAKGNAAVQSMTADPALYTPFYRASLGRSLNVLSDALSQPSEPMQLFRAMNEFKQQLDDVIPHSQSEWFKLPTIDKPAVKILSGMTNDLRSGLEDPEVWGKAGELQQTANKALHEYLPDLKNFKSKFTTKDATGDPIVDPQKINTYWKASGKPGQTVRREMLGDFIDSSEKLRSKINETAQKLGVEPPFVSQPLEFTKSTLQPLPMGGQLADKLIDYGASKLTGEALGIGAGSLAGKALGNPLIGAWVGEKMLSPVFSKIIPPEAFLTPLRYLQGITDAVDGTNKKIGDKARLIFTGASVQSRKSDE